MHWAKFNDAADDALRSSKNSENPMYGLNVSDKYMFKQVAHISKYGMRFFFVDTTLMENKLISEDIKQYFVPPYDEFVVLYESLAFIKKELLEENERLTKRKQMFILNVKCITSDDKNHIKFFLAETALFNRDEIRWCPPSLYGLIDIPLDAPGLIMHPRYIGKEKLSDNEREEAGFQFSISVTVLMNFLIMLSLNNVTTEQVKVPEKLNKSRTIKGKVPLLDYHVLNVDGKRWDSKRDDESDGEYGVRSHMRRGHIRKIQSGRFVWVSACFVHGSIPGFVDKEYAVK